MLAAEMNAGRPVMIGALPDVVIALKRVPRRRIQQLCAHTRLTPRSVIRYQRMLLDKMTPLERRG